MLNRAQAIMIAGLLAAVVAIGWLDRGSSHPPPQQPTISTQTSSATNTQQNQPAKTIRQRLARIWQRTWVDPVAFYTFILSIFTGLLVVVSAFQIFFLIRADETARIAANAAALSAKAAIAIELPIVRADVDKFGYGSGREGTSGQQVWIGEIWFKNAGKTKAFPIELQIGHTVGDSLPKIPIYPERKVLPIDKMLTDEKTLEISLLEFGFDAPTDIYEQLRTQSTKLWFYCNLVYLDFMQTRHEAGFCWQQYESFGMGRLRPDPTPAYNRKT
jgi:hypothetical protein